MELLKDHEKTLDREFASVKKALGSVKGEKTSLRCSPENVEEMVTAADEDEGVSVRELAESALQNVSQVVHSEEIALSEQCKLFTEQTG